MLWPTSADGQWSPIQRVLHRYEQAARYSLLDDQTVLLIAEVEDELLNARALVRGAGRDPLDLPITLE